MTATVNGKAWSAQITGVGHPQSGLLDLSGTMDTLGIDLQLSTAITDTGLYPIDDSLVGCIFTSARTSYVSEPGIGAVHLTTFSSSRAAGTFSFHAKSTAGDSVVVTGGTFNFSLLL
ncbi:MAG: DUF6252 family protein [Bacteroidota bacterium]|nr:DUF6252 family protein [Bacteroidota bacterium]MDP4232657.1 DUF6252 family protein [Bacteroidota bacterium]MDP4243210.1 DUF6252 family protein [Bacteroidota bacterium]MDP4288422.1 DUF6252 family protein [Bacteroidota bacterium]